MEIVNYKKSQLNRMIEILEDTKFKFYSSVCKCKISNFNILIFCSSKNNYVIRISNYGDFSILAETFVIRYIINENELIELAKVFKYE